MTSETSLNPHAPPPPPPPPPPAAAAAAKGWTGSDLAIGGALVVLLIALFLPWFTGEVSARSAALAVSGAADGPTSHGYLWAVFVLAILALVVLVARDAIGRLPGNLPSAGQMLAGATGLAVLLTILGVVQKPSPVAAGPGPVISPVFGHFTVSVGWSYGGFVALLAALVAVVATFSGAGSLPAGRRISMPSLRRRGSSAN